MTSNLTKKLGNYTVTDTGCWEWSGYVKDNGYGYVGSEGKQVRAHRASFEAHVGPIPPGKIICHRCDNRKCINPKHLYAGTQSENITEAYQRGRHPGCGHGEGHHNAKLSEADVLFIRKSDRPQADLSKMFGVSQSTISAAKNGKLWGHVQL